MEEDWFHNSPHVVASSLRYVPLEVVVVVIQRKYVTAASSFIRIHQGFGEIGLLVYWSCVIYMLRSSFVEMTTTSRVTSGSFLTS